MSDAKEILRGVFSRHAAAYRDRLAAAMARREARGRARLIELLELRPGARVLDLGCGPGTLTPDLAAAAGPRGRVIGVDLAEGMLALAARLAPVARMDIERLGLRDEAFDAVACGHTLHLCPDLGAALAEVARVLRPGGRFAASVPAGGIDVRVDRLLEEVFARLPPAPALVQRHPPEAIREAVLGAGLHGAVVEHVEELATYAGPQELIERTMGWWSCAWRLESVTPRERERVRSDALALLRSRLGDGPIEVPGATHVVAAER